jgi:hypothetical protein
MAPSRPRFLGLDVHKDAIAVASVAQAQGAEVRSLGTLGTRQYDSAPRIRTRPSPAKPRLCGSAAGPCGSWLSRELTKKGAACWGGPSRLPQTPGDRVQTDRRAARPLARLARSGDRPPAMARRSGLSPPAQHMGFHADVSAVSDPRERRQRLEQALPDQGHTGRVSPVVDARPAWRGGNAPRPFL